MEGYKINSARLCCLPRAGSAEWGTAEAMAQATAAEAGERCGPAILADAIIGNGDTLAVGQVAHLRRPHPARGNLAHGVVAVAVLLLAVVELADDLLSQVEENLALRRERRAPLEAPQARPAAWGSSRHSWNFFRREIAQEHVGAVRFEHCCFCTTCQAQRPLRNVPRAGAGCGLRARGKAKRGF